MTSNDPIILRVSDYPRHTWRSRWVLLRAWRLHRRCVQCTGHIWFDRPVHKNHLTF